MKTIRGLWGKRRLGGWVDYNTGTPHKTENLAKKRQTENLAKKRHLLARKSTTSMRSPTFEVARDPPLSLPSLSMLLIDCAAN